MHLCYHRLLGVCLLLLVLAACGTQSAGVPVATAPPAPLQETRMPTQDATPEQGEPAMVSVSPSSGGGPVLSPPLGSTATPTPAPLPAPELITLENNQQTVLIARGKAFTLQLGDNRLWTVTVGDPRVLVALPQTATADVQGRYQAGELGETTLEALGDPPCRRANPPCGAPSTLFRLTVRVVEQ